MAQQDCDTIVISTGSALLFHDVPSLAVILDPLQAFTGGYGENYVWSRCYQRIDEEKIKSGPDTGRLTGATQLTRIYGFSSAATFVNPFTTALLA